MISFAKLLFISIIHFLRIEAQNTETTANRNADYPYFATIHRSHIRGQYSFDDVVCSAGILTSNKVLTTCSCVRFLRPVESALFYPIDYYVSVGIGQTGVSLASMVNVTIMNVQRIHYHNSCYLDRFTDLWYGDVVLFTLTDDIIFDTRIRPMPIPEMNMFESSRVFEQLANNRSLSCVALAWSKTSPELVALDVEVLAMTDCVDRCKPDDPQRAIRTPLLCMIRDRVSGFMIKMAEPLNESAVYTGGPLVCNGTVWALVNLTWRCSKGLYYQITSPTEVIFGTINFKRSLVENDLLKTFKRASNSDRRQQGVPDSRVR